MSQFPCDYVMQGCGSAVVNKPCFFEKLPTHLSQFSSEFFNGGVKDMSPEAFIDGLFSCGSQIFEQGFLVNILEANRSTPTEIVSLVINALRVELLSGVHPKTIRVMMMNTCLLRTSVLHDSIGNNSKEALETHSPPVPLTVVAVADWSQSAFDFEE
jgi:hypothetical protein